MSNKVKILMGYTPANSVFEEAEIIAEVETDGEDYNGYSRQETLGICKNQYGDTCIFRGSTDRAKYDECTAIIMNQQGLPISDILLDLVMKLKKLGE